MRKGPWRRRDSEAGSEGLFRCSRVEGRTVFADCSGRTGVEDLVGSREPLGTLHHATGSYWNL